MSSQSFVAGPATHHQLHSHGLPYHQDPPPLANPRRRRRDHDDIYHPYAVPYSHPYAAAAGAAPYHVPRDLFALSHHQERLFPQPPDAPSVAGPPAPKRARRAPDPRWDPPPPVPAAPERLRDEGDPGTLLSLDEIQRRSPSRRDGIDSALEARLRASYCAYLRCLSIRLGLPQTTMATAVVYCHRFFFHRSHACHNRFLVATAALFLASKSEETACLLNTVLRASCEVSQNQEFTLLPYMLRGQDWFQLYRESVLQAEQMILTTLDFELEVAHPYASLSSASNKLGLSHTVLFHVAWNLINEGNKYVCKEVNRELERGDATLQLVENAGRIPFLTGTAAYVEIKNKKSRTKIMGVKIATFGTPRCTLVYHGNGQLTISEYKLLTQLCQVNHQYIIRALVEFLMGVYA